MPGWPLDIDSREFFKLPETWLKGGEDEPGDSPRLYAVSAATFADGRGLKVRYAHPRSAKVLVLSCGAIENSEGDGVVPCNLKNRHETWHRSIVPHGEPPMDVARYLEMRHMQDVWSEYSDEVKSPEPHRVPIADGGTRIRGCFDDV
ncbi:hypothetical protein ACKVMT_06970 [Halobacteriales archaeon Cl-PHB]